MRLPPVLARHRRALFWGALALPLSIMLALAVAGVLAWQQLPPLDALTDYQPREPLRILTADGQLIGEFGTERRRFVALKDTPEPLQRALLAVEDTDFWTHPGLDLAGILRAMLRNLTHSGPMHGASTITQQLARNMFLSNRRTLERKGLEMLFALKMEHELSKTQILEVYMNQIWMGGHSYGFAAAAQRCFGKELAQLSPGEIAMLAGLPKNPAGYDPVSHPERARRRQAVVLERLASVGLISAEQAQAARATPLVVKRPRRLSGIADHAVEMVRAEVVGRYGEEVYGRGLQVTTTLLASEQAAAQTALRRALFDLERRQAYRGAAEVEIGRAHV